MEPPSRRDDPYTKLYILGVACRRRFLKLRNHFSRDLDNSEVLDRLYDQARIFEAFRETSGLRSKARVIGLDWRLREDQVTVAAVHRTLWTLSETLGKIAPVAGDGGSTPSVQQEFRVAAEQPRLEDTDDDEEELLELDVDGKKDIYINAHGLLLELVETCNEELCRLFGMHKSYVARAERLWITRGKYEAANGIRTDVPDISDENIMETITRSLPGLSNEVRVRLWEVLVDRQWQLLYYESSAAKVEDDYLQWWNPSGHDENLTPSVSRAKEMDDPLAGYPDLFTLAQKTLGRAANLLELGPGCFPRYSRLIDPGRFYCFCCGQIRDWSMPVSTTNNKGILWITHILADCSLYICLHNKCDKSHVVYHTKEDWKDHVHDAHSTFSHSESLTNNEEWNMFAGTTVSHTNVHSHLTTDAFLRLIAWDEHAINCALCYQPIAHMDGKTVIGELQDMITEHVASHLESLSRLVLPRTKKTIYTGHRARALESDSTKAAFNASGVEGTSLQQYSLGARLPIRSQTDTPSQSAKRKRTAQPSQPATTRSIEPTRQAHQHDTLIRAPTASVRRLLLRAHYVIDSIGSKRLLKSSEDFLSGQNRSLRHAFTHVTQEVLSDALFKLMQMSSDAFDLTKQYLRRITHRVDNIFGPHGHVSQCLSLLQDPALHNRLTVRKALSLNMERIRRDFETCAKWVQRVEKDFKTIVEYSREVRDKFVDSASSSRSQHDTSPTRKRQRARSLQLRELTIQRLTREHARQSRLIYNQAKARSEEGGGKHKMSAAGFELAEFMRITTLALFNATASISAMNPSNAIDLSLPLAEQIEAKLYHLQETLDKGAAYNFKMGWEVDELRRFEVSENILTTSDSTRAITAGNILRSIRSHSQPVFEFRDYDSSQISLDVMSRMWLADSLDEAIELRAYAAAQQGYSLGSTTDPVMLSTGPNHEAYRSLLRADYERMTILQELHADALRNFDKDLEADRRAAVSQIRKLHDISEQLEQSKSTDERVKMFLDLFVDTMPEVLTEVRRLGASFKQLSVKVAILGDTELQEFLETLEGDDDGFSLTYNAVLAQSIQASIRALHVETNDIFHSINMFLETGDAGVDVHPQGIFKAIKTTMEDEWGNYRKELDRRFTMIRKEIHDLPSPRNAEAMRRAILRGVKKARLDAEGSGTKE